MPSRGPFIRNELHLGRMSPGDAEHAVGALASMSGHPRILLEADGSNGQVRWFIGAEAGIVRRAASVMRPYLPGLRVTPSDGTRSASTAAAAVRLPGHRATPLDTGKVEAGARGVLGALADAGKGEQAQLQVILGPRHRPRHPGNHTAEQRAALKAKLGEHRFSCEVRISARAVDAARSRRLVENVAASIRTFEAPGVALRLRRASARSADRAGVPLLWRLELGVSEVTALLGWPIASRDVELPGVPSPHPHLLPVAPQLPKQGRVVGDSALDASRSVAQGVEEAKRATWVIGPMGTGKSTLLTGLALADAEAGRAIIYIDGKGDSLVEFAERLDPARHDDVVWIDPTDPVPVGVGVFDQDAERQADVVFRVIKDLYGGDLGPRSSNLLHAALLTLARAGGCSLAQLPMLLSNPTFRRSIVQKVASADPMGLGAHWAWFNSLSDAERTQVVAPMRNKLDPVLSLRPGLRALFGQASPTFSFADVFAPGKRPIVLISLGGGELGPEGARVFGSIMLALAWQAAQARTRQPQDQRHPVMAYVDEFQEVARIGDLNDALGRARGLGVAFTLAHQSLGQLSPAMKDAVLSQPRSRICFQLNSKDAREIAAATNDLLSPRDFQELPAHTVYASLLAGGDRAPWATLRTRPLPAKRQDAEVVRARSRAHYGRPIAEVEADLLAAAGFGEAAREESFGRQRRTREGGAS